MKTPICIAVCLLLICQTLLAQNVPYKKIYTTQRISGTPPVIDGHLDDSVWVQGHWEGDFVQYEPYENMPPTFQTEFKVFYDDNNLYVAFHAIDDSPDSIVRRLSRRDDGQGDLVAIQFDSYFDHLTGFTFMVTAAGIKVDMIALKDGQEEDPTWDPVWYAKTSITENGWAAEMQIPFTQLRFGKQQNHIWGLQVARHLFRKQETSLWQYIPRNAPGWVHLIGEMHGLNNIKPHKQVDMMPYTVGKIERFEEEGGNPFKTGKSHNLNAGLDAKIGITNNLTLDLTVNPDFGQVEADPSVVNLTAFETFFEEKRPFFIEGRNILSYRLQPGDGDGSAENIFYSRRIGRRPQHYPGIENAQYLKMPSNTTILGAAKLTGKTRNGLSIGVMESFTAREYAIIDTEGRRTRQQAEPATNYFASRVSKDFDQGNTVVGGMLTAVNRDLNDPDLLFLRRSAYSGGVDMEHNWKNKTYTFRTKLIFSHVRGDSLALIRTQRSPARYFQRPDANHLTLDSSRTYLSGHGGSLEFWKGGNSNWQFGGFVEWKSPGLELNDIGYVRNTDEIFQVGYIGYRENDPKGIFNSWRVNVNEWIIYDFSGAMTNKGGNINANIQFKNYWFFGTGINVNGSGLSKSALRGGPMLRLPGDISNWMDLSSDSRRDVQVNAGWSLSNSWNGHTQGRNFFGGITYRPTPGISIKLSPQYSLNHNNLQYVSNIETKAGMRYVNARIDQKTFSLSLRANLNLTPDLTIQYWGQPFISTGKYKNYKHIISPRADSYAERFHEYTNDQIRRSANDEIYEVDENRDGVVDYQFDNPDFKALFFQSNLVLRWEYLPGSTLFLVWSQGRRDYFPDGAFSMFDDTQDLFQLKPHNIFLIKLSYRLGLS
ncbi:MAG: DUF5916 domain-containing protein [Bacteroidales bacterium]|nr:DUF5916 domain-containing protein [Bacteroidales bacterium]MDZ4204085.1 DUF5916 domain-containing protein [Bacteroidales bacterium]